MKATYIESKPRYEILDGLRGVAAVMVILFHMFECYSPGPLKQIINHGYLSVDFFFALSGFVIAYAYDDRWNRMNLWDFCKRRIDGYFRDSVWSMFFLPQCRLCISTNRKYPMVFLSHSNCMVLYASPNTSKYGHERNISNQPFYRPGMVTTI